MFLPLFVQKICRRLTRVSLWRVMRSRHARLVAAILLVAGCAMVDTAPYKEGPPIDSGDKRVLTVWALSDIHPRSDSERQLFEHAVADVNTLGPVDLGIIAGDLLKSRSREDSFDWFLQTRSRAQVDHWFEIAGNHDVRSLPLFSHYFPKPPYYGVSVGNILFLMLSDTSNKSRTDISEEGFLWWKKMVMANQDKIIVTVSHAQLADSGLFGSFVPSRVIFRSERFEEVLRSCKVDLWLSGHLHLPQGLSGTVAVQERFNNTCFVNVSSISSEMLLDSQSRFLLFTNGAKKMWIRSRNHTRQSFEPGLNIPLELSKPFVWDGSPPRLILPDDDSVTCASAASDYTVGLAFLP